MYQELLHEWKKLHLYEQRIHGCSDEELLEYWKWIVGKKEEADNVFAMPQKTFADRVDRMTQALETGDIGKIYMYYYTTKHEMEERDLL